MKCAILQGRHHDDRFGVRWSAYRGLAQLPNRSNDAFRTESPVRDNVALVDNARLHSPSNDSRLLARTADEVHFQRLFLFVHMRSTQGRRNESKAIGEYVREQAQDDRRSGLQVYHLCNDRFQYALSIPATV